jgi:diguanylate cyclase
MRIHWKVTILIVGLFAVLGLTAVFVNHSVLMPSFAALEESEAQVAMKRVQFALDRSFAPLELAAASWGNWTDAWRFAQDHDPAFVRDKLPLSDLKQLNINLRIITDRTGELLACATLDLQTEKPLDLDFAQLKTLPAVFPWRQRLLDGRPAHGFLQTNRGVLMIAGAPVLDGFGQGPSRGMVLMGRLISRKEIEQIGAQAQTSVHLLPPGSSSSNRSAESDPVLHVDHSFEDLYGRPILALQVDFPREITRRGYAAVHYATAYLVAAAVMVVILLVMVLNRTVLDPLARMTRHAVSIGESEDLTSRLEFKSTDEIGVLAREFDRMVARVARLAYLDSLTGLPNREQAHRRLQTTLAQALHREHALAVMYIDLDNFKCINDTLGHAIGDEVLITAAARLRKALRGGDERSGDELSIQRSGDLSRLGGDEFIVVLPEIRSSEDAGRVAERLIAAVHEPMQISKQLVVITPSIGIAMAPTDGTDADTLLRHADLAMYFSKRRAPGTCAFFDASMNAGTLQRYTIENKLRGAVERGELSLHYQPQFNIATGKVTGMEALLRWTHPELGAVSPLEFIPVAESTGLILPIGEWVLRSACQQAKQWHDEGLTIPRMSVNVAPRQFASCGFAEQVVAILAETGLAPGQLELEITESMIVVEEARAARTLEQLHMIGVSIAIDDFGTGYSNFQRLQHVAIDRLKIDRCFIRDLGNDKGDRAIATAILSMAKALQLEVIAEGVESMAQYRFLQHHDCAQCQGFLLSRPLPAGEARLMLQRAERDFDGSPTQRLLQLRQAQPS